VVAALVVLAVLGSALGGNDDKNSSPAAASSTVQTAAPTTSLPPAPTTPAPPPPTSEAVPTGVDFAMPDLVGMDLQSAQNAVQSFGVFLSNSHDLLGSRNQVVDSNWMVCDQNIPVGQQVTGDAEGLIDFGVVKREEFCP
jgi:hypothetical protein